MADPYLTPDELREVPDLKNDSGNTTDAALADYVAEFEDLAERYLGVAYRRRTVTETRPQPRGCTLLLGRVEVYAVTAAVIDGTALSSDERTAIVIDPGVGSLERSYWGRSNVITYTHGYEAPTAALKRACRLWVRREALADRTPRGDNLVTQFVEDAAGGTFVGREATANWDAGRPTGWLDVDRILNQLPNRRIPGIA